MDDSEIKVYRKRINLKHSQSLLMENIKLKKDKDEIEQKFNDLVSMLDNKMDQMISLLQDIKNKEVTVYQSSSATLPADLVKTKKSESTKMFIPTMEPDNLKSSIGDITKKLRKTDLQKSVKELTQLQDNPGN